MASDTTNPVDGYSRVRVLFADQLNLARGKYIPMSFAEKGESRLCIGAYAVTYSKAMVDAPGAGLADGLPDIEMVFDPQDLRPGWEPNTHIALCDLELGGEPAELCGRNALKKAIHQWQELGFDPMIGYETEAYIFERDENGGWIPYQTPGAFVYGTGPFTDPAGLIDDIWATAQKCNLPIESINAEYDAPQFELTMRFADALKAADDIFLFRNMAREVLYKKGYLLSFMPMPIPGLSGSGLHLNLSFKDSHGKNVMDGNTNRDQLSPLVSGCIAGLLKYHEALGGLLAPTTNSYDRLQPGQLSGYWANWGYDHRGVAVRISGETGNAARIEHRVGDCAVSPYVAAAALLQAARLGFVNNEELTPAETGDGIDTVNTERHIARDLGTSLDYLEAADDLVSAISKDMIENYIAIKRAEIAELAGKTKKEIFDYYAPFI